ncbi:hypothetical protein HDU89_008379 [Geranomyces variabilis]|nr:hypothetical protein HDU89_008379 [Geranomyces variabilis]
MSLTSSPAPGVVSNVESQKPPEAATSDSSVVGTLPTANKPNQIHSLGGQASKSARSITDELNELGKSLDRPHPGGGAVAAASTRASEIEQVANQLLVSRSPLTAAAERARPEASTSGRLAQIQSAKVVTGIKYVRPKTVAPAQISGKPTETRAKSIDGQGSASGSLADERIENAASATAASRDWGSAQAADSKPHTSASERGRSELSASDLRKTPISTALSGGTNAASPSLSSAFGEAMDSITAAYAGGNTGPLSLASDQVSEGTRQGTPPPSANESVVEKAADLTATERAAEESRSASSANEPDAKEAVHTTATTLGEGLAMPLTMALPGACEEGGLPSSKQEPDDIKATDHTSSVGARRSSTLFQGVMGPRPPPASFGEPRAPSAIPPSLAISLSSDNLDKSLPPTPIPLPSPVKDDTPVVNIIVSTSSENSTPAGGSSKASTPDTSVVVTLKRTAAGGFRNPLAHFSAASSDSSVDSVHEPLEFTIHSPSSTIEVMRRTTKVVELEDLPTSRRGSILTSTAGTPGVRRESFLATIPSSEKGGENAQSQPQRSRRESLRNDSASSSPRGSRRGSLSGNVTNVVPVARRSSIVKVAAAPPVLPNFRFSNVPLRSKIGIAASPDGAAIPAPQGQLTETARPPTPNLPLTGPVFDQPKFVGVAKPNPAPTTSVTETVDHPRPESDAARSPAPDQAAPASEDGDTPSLALPAHIILAGERLLLNARTAMGSHSHLSESDNHSSMGDLRGHHMDRSVSMNTLASIIDGSDGDVTGLSIPVKVNGVDCKISFRANRLTCVDVRGKMYGRYFALDMSRILVAGNIGSTVTMFAIPPKVLTAGVKFRAFAFDCANEVQGAAWCARLNFLACEGNFPDLVEKKAFLMIDESDEKTLLDLIRKYITPVLACVGKELTVQVRRRRTEPQLPDFKTTNFVAKISSKVPVQDAERSWLLKGALSATTKIEDVNVLPSGGPIDPVELALAIVKGKDGVIVVLNAQVHRAGLVGMVKKILKQ